MNLQKMTIISSAQDASSKFYSIAFSYTHRDLYDTIFDACSPANLFRLGRVGRLSHIALKDYMARAFDIIKLFGKFFTDPSSFRELQAKTDLVVSGSTALQFFNRCVYPDSDLDLYVDVSQAAPVCNWIMTSGDLDQPYQFVPSSDQQVDFSDEWRESCQDIPPSEYYEITDYTSNTSLYRVNRVLAVFSFTSTDPLTDRTKKVQVIITEMNAFLSILTFHSTVVMNAITHKAAYSLFPKATFEKKSSLVTAIRGTKHAEALSKYVNRGWILKKSITSEEQKDENSPLRYEKRWVTDKKSWIIPLNTFGLRREDDSLEFGSFNVACNLRDMSPEMRFLPVKESTLSRSFVLNAEFGNKIKAYIGVLKEMQTLPDGEELERNICDWSDLNKHKCTCKLGGYSYAPLHQQMLSCPAFDLMKLKCGVVRLIEDDKYAKFLL